MWIEVLEVPALLNTVENSVWIPVWNRETGENLRFRLSVIPDFVEAVVRVFQQVCNSRRAILANTHHEQQTSFQPSTVDFKVTILPPDAGSTRRLLKEEHTIFRNHLDRLFHGECITLEHEDHVQFRQMRTSITFRSLTKAFRCILAHGTHKRAAHRLRWSFDATFLLSQSPTTVSVHPHTSPSQILASLLQGQPPRHNEHVNRTPNKENQDPSSPPVPTATRRNANFAANAEASTASLLGSLTRRDSSSPIVVQSSPRRPSLTWDNTPSVPSNRRDLCYKPHWAPTLTEKEKERRYQTKARMQHRNFLRQTSPIILPQVQSPFSIYLHHHCVLFSLVVVQWPVKEPRSTPPVRSHRRDR